jgi:hypothetical protein
MGEIMRIAMWMALAMGCGNTPLKESDTGTGPVGDTGPIGDVSGFDDFIYTDAAYDGDLDCLTGALGTEAASPGCADRTVTMSATVLDFQSDQAVDEANVEIFLVDGIAGVPDHDVETDINGMISAAMPTCTPFTYRVSTDAAADLTKITIESHDVLPFSTSSLVSHEMNSVSSTTYSLIPAIFGVSPDPTKGIVAGTAYDCDGDPIAGLQVVVKDSNGNVPSGMLAGYFVDDFPAKEAEATSSDGIWVLVDVPTGIVTVEGYVYNGSGHDLVASTTLEVLTDSINISSIHAGVSNGVKMPESCTETCAR